MITRIVPVLIALLSLFAQAEQPVEKAPFYVDVRTPAEFASGHVAGAVNIPHDEMNTRWKELQAYKDKPVVVYCRSGRRSAIALEVLRRNGFSKAENGGAFKQLAAKGVPTER